jgi:hypothetical protein
VNRCAAVPVQPIDDAASAVMRLNDALVTPPLLGHHCRLLQEAAVLVLGDGEVVEVHR